MINRIGIFIFLFFLVSHSFAQKLDEVQNYMLINKLEPAKTIIDKLANNPKVTEKSDFWLWKARVYASIFADSSLRNSYPDAGEIGIDALGKYLIMDPQTKVLKATANLPGIGYQVIDNLYVTYFSLGRDHIKQNDWVGAYNDFKMASKVGGYITQQNWKNNGQKIDTLTVLLTANCAQNAGLDSMAASYYMLLANLNVAGPNNQIIYDFLTAYFLKTKQETLLNQYADKAVQLYPNNNIWELRKRAYIQEVYTLAKKIQLYNNVLATSNNHLKEEDYRFFGDMFSSIPKEIKATLDSADIALYSNKAVDAYSRAFAIDTLNAILAFNIGVIDYDKFNTLDDKKSGLRRQLQALNLDYKNTPPITNRDKKVAFDATFKKNVANLQSAIQQLNKPISDIASACIEWFLISYTILKDKTDMSNDEKNCYKQAVNFLSNLYSYKRDALGGVDPKAYDLYDQKFKFFDNLASKLY